MGIAAFALRDFLKGKANAGVIQAGHTIIENSTGGDPKSAGQSILRVQEDALRIVERDNPSALSVIKELREACTTLNHEINAAEKMYARLVQYRQEHPIFKLDEAVDPLDDDLIKAGYKTEGEINRGIIDFVEIYSGYDQMIKDMVTYSNNMRIRNEVNQDRSSDARSSESSDDHFRDF
jgi:hypothetical protein